MGAKGCSVLLRGDCCHLDAIPVSAVDTTAAGDSFFGAFLHRLLQHSFSSLDELSPGQIVEALNRTAAAPHRFPQGLHSCVAQLGRSDRHFKLKVLLFLYRFHIRSKASACASCRRKLFPEYVGSCDYRYIRVQRNTEAGIHGVTVRSAPARRISPFPSPASKRIFFACKIEAIPMVIACLGTCPALAKNLAFARIVS